MRVKLLVAVFIAVLTPLTALAQVQFLPGAGGAGDGGTHTSVMKVHRLSPIHDLAATCDGGMSETLVTRYFVLTAADGQNRQTARSNEVSVADCPQDGRAALTWSSVHGATSYFIYAGAAAGQTTLVNPVTLNGLPLASNTEYVYREAAYCWGNGACGQTSEWDWNGLDSGMPSFSAGAGGNDHKASADFSDGMTRDMQTSFLLPASWNSGAATTLDVYRFGAGD